MTILEVRHGKEHHYWDGYGFTSNPMDAIPWSLVEFHKDHVDKMKKAAEKAGYDVRETYVCEFSGYKILNSTKVKL